MTSAIRRDKQAIVEACGLLHTAIADVSEMAQHVNDWVASNGGARTVLTSKERQRTPGSTRSIGTAARRVARSPQMGAELPEFRLKSAGA